MDIYGRVGVGDATGRMIVFVLVACPRSSAILTSEFLVLSQYSSDDTTDCLICRMERMSVADRLR